MIRPEYLPIVPVDPRPKFEKTMLCGKCGVTVPERSYCRVVFKSGQMGLEYYCPRCDCSVGFPLAQAEIPRDWTAPPDIRTFVRETGKKKESLLDKASIEKLKTMRYQDYLKTSHWKTIRAKALKLADHRCQLCNSTKSLNVHHRTYERRGCERLSDLTVLCQSCHAKFHDKLGAVK